MKTLTIALLLLSPTGYSQQPAKVAVPGKLTAGQTPVDKWTGTWKMSYKPWPQGKPVTLELQIGVSSEQMLYPALIKLDYPPFSGIYHVLLAKKNDQQLGIGRGK